MHSLMFYFFLATKSFGQSFIEHYAVSLVDRHDYECARRFLWLNRHQPEALHWIGMMHMERLWGSKEEGNYFFKLAAQRLYAPSMCALGDSYISGDGLPLNPTKAFYWYKKAAHLGFGPAFFHLAVLYKDGRGVNRSRKKALFYFKKASLALPHLKTQILRLMHTLYDELS